LAQLAHISGVVTLEAVIDEEGNVINPKILKGDDLFNKAAHRILGFDWLLRCSNIQNVNI
jgi:hypothetical protein